MNFKINRIKMISGCVIVVLIILCLNYFLAVRALIILNPIIIGTVVSQIYLALKNQSILYEISDNVLIFKRDNVEIHIDEIKEVVRHYNCIIKWINICDFDFGYQYFIVVNGYDYELIKKYRNSDHKSIHEVLNKKYKKAYRDEKKLKLVVKIK